MVQVFTDYCRPEEEKQTLSLRLDQGGADYLVGEIIHSVGEKTKQSNSDNDRLGSVPKMVYAKSAKRILVVDDDSLQVQGTVSKINSTKMYTAKGIVFCGSNSIEILNDIQNRDYDILLMGVVMPGINGFNFTKLIRKEGSNIPIILFTGGYTNSFLAINSMVLGVHDVVFKPISENRIVTSIKTTLQEIKLEERGPFKPTGNNQEKLLLFDNTEKNNFSGLIREYYQSGKLMAELNFRNGKLNGNSRVYRRSGTLLVNGNFINGLEHGKTCWFDNNDRVCREQIFINDDGGPIEYST